MNKNVFTLDYVYEKKSQKMTIFQGSQDSVLYK